MSNWKCLLGNFQFEVCNRKFQIGKNTKSHFTRFSSSLLKQESDNKCMHRSNIVIYGATGGGVISAIAASRTLKEKFKEKEDKGKHGFEMEENSSIRSNTIRRTNSLNRKECVSDVILISTNKHVGGMVTGGLQNSDIANASVIGGVTYEYYSRVAKEYNVSISNWKDVSYWRNNVAKFLAESHVKERVMNDMLSEANVTMVYNAVGIKNVITKNDGNKNTRIECIETVKDDKICGNVFIDGSYEGDLAYYAGAEMTWRRESRSQYEESDAGRQIGIRPDGIYVDPYYQTTDSNGKIKESVIPHVYAGLPANIGDGDDWVQAYTFRLCFTNSPSHRIPIDKPDSYNPNDWEFWRRLYKLKPPNTLAEAGVSCLGPVPNNYPDCFDANNFPMACKKCDMLGMNHGTDYVNGAWMYPNGTIEERERIRDEHIQYIKGLLWFWLTDDAVPEAVKNELRQYGHCNDEYDGDSNPPHWPHQLYVREARRLIGSFVWTENEPSQEFLERSIGLGSYTFDSHVVSRVIHSQYYGNDYIVDEGRVNEPNPGIIQSTFQIPYDVMLPRTKRNASPGTYNLISNLLVPIAMSASHVRYNAIRMEPTWMIVSHSAAVAAVLSIFNEQTKVVHDVDIHQLQMMLLEQKQILFDF